MIYLPRSAFKIAHLPEGHTGLALIHSIVHNSSEIVSEIILAIAD